MLLTSMARLVEISLLFTFFVWIHADPETTEDRTLIKLNEPVDLLCRLEGTDLKNYKWKKISGFNNTERFEGLINSQGINEKHGAVHFDHVTREDNGIYECSAQRGTDIVSNQIQLSVVEKPEIVSFNAIFVMPDKIYLKWEIREHNTRIKRSEILYRTTNNPGLVSRLTELSKIKVSYFLADAKDLKEKNTTYEIGIRPMKGNKDPEKYVPLERPSDEDFVLEPTIDPNHDSITITWNRPRNLTDYYYYEVSQTPGVHRPDEHIHSNITTNNLTISSLTPGTEYRFKVKFCVINVHHCGNWCKQVTGNTTTMPSSKNGENESAGAERYKSISTSSGSSESINLFTIIIFSLYFLTSQRLQ